MEVRIYPRMYLYSLKINFKKLFMVWRAGKEAAIPKLVSQTVLQCPPPRFQFNSEKRLLSSIMFHALSENPALHILSLRSSTEEVL